MAVVKSGLWLALTLALLSCGVNQGVQLRGASSTPHEETKGPVPDLEQTYFEGQFTATDKSTVDLKDYRDKPLVLVFASDSCTTCKGEAEDFIAHLGGRLPSKIAILHVMAIGYPPDKKDLILLDALDWKEWLKIPWTLGIDSENRALFKKYCESDTVPCTVVQMPDKGIVYRHIGKSTAKELEAITGAWE